MVYFVFLFYTKKRVNSMKIFQTLKECVFSKKEKIFSFFSCIRKYLGVIIIFFIVLWYNIVVSPVEELSSDSKENIDQISLNETKPDLEGDKPEKVYKDIFDSMEGDWYRLSVRSQSLDADENILIFALSSWGQEKQIGEFSLKKGEELLYKEFIFQTDDVYQDIVFRKEGKEEKDRWRGGRILLSDIRITRLDISSQQEAQILQPSVLRQSSFHKVLVGESSSEEQKKIFFSDKVEFPLWGIFTSPGDRMLSVSFLAKRSRSQENTKYVLELREYSKESSVVEKKVLHSRSFSESDVEKEMKKMGVVKFDFPVKLESEKEYLLGIRYRDTDAKGNLDFVPLVSEGAVESGFLLAEIQPSFDEGDEKNKLLLGAKIEDIGSYLRYEYKTEGSFVDFLNISDMSESISFAKKEARILGNAKVGEFFVHTIDTLMPFSEIVIRAQQFGNYEKQIRMEYSFDQKEWIEVSFVQSEGESQNFFLRLELGEKKQQSLFVRTRYAGEEDSKRKFGLERLYITAKILKDEK